MVDLNQLNDDIYKLQKAILMRKNLANDMKRDYEFSKFNYKNNLDKKIFTNDDKREAEALKQPEIKAKHDDYHKYIIETEFLEIECEHKMRAFNIMLMFKESEIIKKY